MRRKASRKHSNSVSHDDFIAIEIQDLDKKGETPFGPEDFQYMDSSRLPPPFDFERLTRFMAYGFLMAPVQFKWFAFLHRTFPVTKVGATGAALKRVAFDQLLFSPVGELDS